MKIVTVDAKKCVRWRLADRSSFEFGDIHALAQDILENGQIEPVLLRKSPHNEDQFEIIAGSRRWRACLEADIPLKGILQDLSDAEAAIAQIKENQHLGLCDYSKGITYAKVLKEQTMTHAQLAEVVGCSRAKFENFLSFEKVPTTIWKAVDNLSRVSSRTAATIYALSKNGPNYEEALILLADEIRKGTGCNTLEKMVLALVTNNSQKDDLKSKITLPDGTLIATWTKNGLQFSKKILFDQNEISNLLIQYFQKMEAIS